jgi:hypothetical protein
VRQLFAAPGDRRLLLAELDGAQATPVEQEHDHDQGVDEERKENGAFEPPSLGTLDALDELFEVRRIGVVGAPGGRRGALCFFVFDAEHLTL